MAAPIRAAMRAATRAVARAGGEAAARAVAKAASVHAAAVPQTLAHAWHTWAVSTGSDAVCGHGKRSSVVRASRAHIQARGTWPTQSSRRPRHAARGTGRKQLSFWQECSLEQLCALRQRARRCSRIRYSQREPTCTTSFGHADISGIHDPGCMSQLLCVEWSAHGTRLLKQVQQISVAEWERT